MAAAKPPNVAFRLAADLGPPRGLRAFEISDVPELVLLEWEAARPGAAEAGLGLSATEWEIVAMVQMGLSNPEIARRRGRSARTVANQLASIFRKCGVSSRLELLAFLHDRSHAEKARPDRRR